MAHPAQQAFCQAVKARFPEMFRRARALDVGSQDINGSNRTLFAYRTEYVGLDLGPGKGVDVVAHVADYFVDWLNNDWPPFDVVISTEALEHDSRWEESLAAMYGMLAPGGLMVMTCAGPGREEHGTTRTTPGNSPYTTDYYRNLLVEDVRRILPESLFSESAISYVPEPVCDIHFWGIKA